MTFWPAHKAPTFWMAAMVPIAYLGPEATATTSSASRSPAPQRHPETSTSKPQVYQRDGNYLCPVKVEKITITNHFTDPTATRNASNSPTAQHGTLPLRRQPRRLAPQATTSCSVSATRTPPSQGWAGNDSLGTFAGNDTLDGGNGKLPAGGGLAQRYLVDNAGDMVIEAASAGLDTVQAGISYTLGANVENLALTGTARQPSTAPGQ